MAKIKTARLICSTCGGEFTVEGNRAYIRCDKCGTPQQIVLDYERVGTAFLKLKG